MSSKDQSWVLLDTETTGIIDPIYILEIYAQRMVGFTPQGPPLHLFINHRVPIPPEATAIHGYTNSFISKMGIDPVQAHKAIEQYSKSSPICSHNLGYDWCRCLIPERRRLNRELKLLKGFCTLQLFRRTLDYQESYKLTSLKEAYKIKHPKDCPSHSAKGDVMTVLEILKSKVIPILEEKNITTLEAIEKLSKTTPISTCRQKLGLSSPYGKTNDINKPLEQIVLETLADTLDLTEVEDARIVELDKWLSQNKSDKNNTRDQHKELNKEIRRIVERGIIAPEQRLEMLEMIQPMLPLKELATRKQKEYLANLGANFNKDLTKKDASDLIDEIKGNKKRNFKTRSPKQIEETNIN